MSIAERNIFQKKSEKKIEKKGMDQSCRVVDDPYPAPARADLSSVALAKEEGGASPVPKSD